MALQSSCLNYYYYYWYSALGPVWAETRAQSGDWYGSGMLHPGQVLRGSLPLLSPSCLNIGSIKVSNCNQ